MRWPWKKEELLVAAPVVDLAAQLDNAYSNQMKLLRRARTLNSQLEISERSLTRSKTQSAKDQLAVITLQKNSLQLTIEELNINIQTIRHQRRQLKALNSQTNHLDAMNQIHQSMQAQYQAAEEALSGIECEITLKQAQLEVDLISADSTTMPIE